MSVPLPEGEGRPEPRARVAGPRALSRAARIGAPIGAALFLAALYGLPLLSVAKNRLALGDPVYAARSLGPEAHSAAILVVAAALMIRALPSRRVALAAAGLLATALVVLVLGLGGAAADLVAGRPPAARASLAAGAWIALALLVGGIVLSSRRTALPGLGAGIAAVVALVLSVAWRQGILDGLSLAVEFRARRGLVVAAIGEHLELAAGALLLAGLGAVLLALWRRGQIVVEALVSGVQVVPAVALFGALVALLSGLLRAAPPLRDLGIGALGATPAILGVSAYLLLPLWRGLNRALQAPDPAMLDAAAGLGLTRAQTLLRVRLPIGVPILIGAVRVACVQSIGLATLGALIGAGGLGRIVFDGMAQFAPDLILLGAIPIVALSLAVERVLGRAEAAARRRRA
ncbi:ABC transporter permease subunit [Methylobacterium durans]|uniref:ABC transporter permease subunit n=1 Tax=Methylobacterium durans TaxID=2202825 RepID=UPI002AFE56CD|nr:ABC transporter permease subunit [Methylobacterium durans]MEA1830737.1 ABC transporter permease subunit [Methylobacterium durans]